MKAQDNKGKGTDPKDNGVPDLSGIQFAKPKTVKGKSTRPICKHVYTDGTQCQLRVMEGETEFCVNHVPAERKLTEPEAIAIAGWLEGLTPADRFVAYVRALGWYKAKQQASELATLKQ